MPDPAKCQRRHPDPDAAAAGEQVDADESETEHGRAEQRALKIERA
jgi:hypothetical protein